jgi:hypothetical protein
MHHRNAAEQAIQTMKAHFLTILDGINPGFLKSWWDLLLPQAKLTINLLRQLRYEPKKSAWEVFNGPYNLAFVSFVTKDKIQVANPLWGH